MNVRIKTNEDEVFKQWLTLVNTLRKEKLTNVEIIVLSKLLFIDYKYRHHSKEKRDIIIFHSETKKRIKESLNNMSNQVFLNTMMKLRKKNLITKNSINISLPHIIDNKVNINITLEIQMD